MLVNPRLLFLYWVTGKAIEKILARAAVSAEIRMDEENGDGRFEEVGRQEFDFRTGNWYLGNERADRVVRLRLGLRERAGFREILRTNSLRVPRELPGGAREIWMDRNDLRAGRRTRVEAPPRRLAVSGAAISATAPSANAIPAATTSTAAARSVAPGTSPPGRVAWGAPPVAVAVRVEPAAYVEPAVALAGAVTTRVETAETSRGRKADLRGAARRAARGYVAFVLHAHLPFVRRAGREYFHEEQWLFEGITETYLPLLDALEHLRDDAVPARITLSLSPTLMAMLRDPLLMGKYERRLDALCDLAEREVRRTRRDPDFGPVAGFYRDRLLRFRELFVETYRRDLVARFARLESEGLLEIIACAATHAFLPNLMPTPAALRAQIAVGVAEHRLQIGRAPRGIWLPECAYVEGLHAFLAEAGLEYFFVDAHGLRNATSRPRFDCHAPVLCPSGVAAFGRDQESSEQVWSAQRGYPGDPSYRDFYRDIGYDLDADYVAPFLDPAGTRGMTGLKYHRITGQTDAKQPYRRAWALRTAARHAADFVANRGWQIEHLEAQMGRKPIVVSMYDAELFGHWWFEGPEWLEAVLRGLPARGLAAISPAEYLEERPVAQVAEPCASSWGERGYYDVWLNGENDWITAPLHDAGRRMTSLAARHAHARGVPGRLLAQAGRELLLAQASDWPFMLRNHTNAEFARAQVREHLERFDRLATQLETGRADATALHAIEAQDNLFPDLDPALWSHS